MAHLYVGQLPFKHFSQLDVTKMFERYGQVSKVKYHPSKGEAFVTFDHTADADDAIRSLHGKIAMQGRKQPLQVFYANSTLKWSWFGIQHNLTHHHRNKRSVALPTFIVRTPPLSPTQWRDEEVPPAPGMAPLPDSSASGTGTGSSGDSRHAAPSVPVLSLPFTQKQFEEVLRQSEAQQNSLLAVRDAAAAAGKTVTSSATASVHATDPMQGMPSSATAHAHAHAGAHSPPVPVSGAARERSAGGMPPPTIGTSYRPPEYPLTVPSRSPYVVHGQAPQALGPHTHQALPTGSVIPGSAHAAPPLTAQGLGVAGPAFSPPVALHIAGPPEAALGRNPDSRCSSISSSPSSPGKRGRIEERPDASGVGGGAVSLAGTGSGVMSGPYAIPWRPGAVVASPSSAQHNPYLRARFGSSSGDDEDYGTVYDNAQSGPMRVHVDQGRGRGSQERLGSPDSQQSVHYGASSQPMVHSTLPSPTQLSQQPPAPLRSGFAPHHHHHSFHSKPKSSFSPAAQSPPSSLPTRPATVARQQDQAPSQQPVAMRRPNSPSVVYSPSGALIGSSRQAGLPALPASQSMMPPRSASMFVGDANNTPMMGSQYSVSYTAGSTSSNRTNYASSSGSPAAVTGGPFVPQPQGLHMGVNFPPPMSSPAEFGLPGSYSLANITHSSNSAQLEQNMSGAAPGVQYVLSASQHSATGSYSGDVPFPISQRHPQAQMTSQQPPQQPHPQMQQKTYVGPPTQLSGPSSHAAQYPVSYPSGEQISRGVSKRNVKPKK